MYSRVFWGVCLWSRAVSQMLWCGACGRRAREFDVVDAEVRPFDEGRCSMRVRSRGPPVVMVVIDCVARVA